MREDDVLYWVNRLRDGSIQSILEAKTMTELVKLILELTEEVKRVGTAKGFNEIDREDRQMKEHDVMYWVNQLKDGNLRATLELKPMTALVKLILDLTREAKKVGTAVDSLGTLRGAFAEATSTYYFDLIDIRHQAFKEIERRSSSART